MRKNTTGFSLEERTEKLYNYQFGVPHTRKSLVKGERFIRSVWMAEMMS